mmetsp:Transcript_13360/g.32665  ORF Transcript_13360/g.32665 Transcript_13360/m.32665 type:complete len:267 (-) Transcript_13360:4728-5528(-)
MYTPSAAASLSDSKSLGGWVTSDVMTTSSSAHLSAACLRDTSCFMAVRKPCGLKKPVIQYALGRPRLSHLLSWSKRCSMPVNQLPRVDASHDFDSQNEGMRAVNSASTASIRLPLSAMVPAIASRRFLSVVVVRRVMMLRRSISCRRCTVSGCVGPPGSFLSFSLVSSLSNTGGTLDSRSSQILSTISSRDSPPAAAPPLGMVSRMVDTPSCTCSVRNVTSALGCRPKISGDSVPGSCSICCRNMSTSMESGTRYEKPERSSRYSS